MCIIDYTLIYINIVLSLIDYTLCPRPPPATQGWGTSRAPFATPLVPAAAPPKTSLRFLRGGKGGRFQFYRSKSLECNGYGPTPLLVDYTPG